MTLVRANIDIDVGKCHWPLLIFTSRLTKIQWSLLTLTSNF